MDPDFSYIIDQINNSTREECLKKFKRDIVRIYIRSCKTGHKQIAEYMYHLSKISERGKININVNENYLFRYSCQKGYLDIAKWLYEISKTDDNTLINIHSCNEYAFRLSCAYGHYDVAEWLYQISQAENSKINISINDDEAFKISCYNGHQYIAEWLCTLDKRYCIVRDCDILQPLIRDIRTILKCHNDEDISKILYDSKAISDLDICMVCLSKDNCYWINLDCNHWLCSDCFTNIDVCPYRCSECIDLKNVRVYIVK